MNFLAHFHLAWPDAALLAGGLEGDYYKGPLRGDLQAGIEHGVRLHRAIDAYTDCHPEVVSLRRQLHPALRRYAGIVIDLGFDYYLSQHWSRYATLPLADFNATVYRKLEHHEGQLSDGASRMLGRMREHDILNLYREWDTVTATARRLGERFRRGNPFADIERQLAPARGQMERAFLAFYPDLVAFSEQQIASLPQRRDSGSDQRPS